MKRELTRREAEFLDGILGDMSAERWLEQLQEFVMDATLLTIKTDVQDSTISSERTVTLLTSMHALIWHFRQLCGGYKEA